MSRVAESEEGRVRRSLVLLAAALLVAGCTLGEALQDPGEHVDLTPSVLAGTWHAGTRRWLTFAEDGTFTALDLPAEAFRGHLNGSDPAASLDGSGSWAIEGLPGDPSAAPHAIVRLRFQRLGGVPVAADGPDLTALRPADGQVYLVFFYVTEHGGNGSTGYLRCEADCSLPGGATGW